jgi:hypothetical protein
MRKHISALNLKRWRSNSGLNHGRSLSLTMDRLTDRLQSWSSTEDDYQTSGLSMPLIGVGRHTRGMSVRALPLAPLLRSAMPMIR